MSTPRPGGFSPFQSPPTVRRRPLRRRPRWLRLLGVLGLAAACLAVTGAAVFDRFRDVSGTAEEPMGRYARTLMPGDCFDTHTGIFGVNRSVEKVDCTGPHDGEMFGLWWTDAGPEAEYPGRDGLTPEARTECRGQAHLYTGWEEQPDVRVVHGTPSEHAWSEGVRNGGCYFLAKDGKISGSVREGPAAEPV